MTAKLKFALPAIVLWWGFFCVAARAADLYERQVNRTAIIVDAEGGRGTGFVVDKERHLVATNYHVAHEKGQTYDIFWELVKPTGEPWTHQEYIDGKAYLRELGKVGTGYVVAKDSTKDIALLYVTDIPDWIEECPFAESRPKDDDVVYFVGHPGERLPFRYSVGEVDYVGHDSWTSKNGQSIDADIIRYQTQSYSGFSGSAIVNKDGKLVGIHHGNVGGVTATAIDARELKQLLDTVHSTKVVGVYNETENTVYFSFRNGSGDWVSDQVEPGDGRVYWNDEGDFKIKFAWSFEEGHQEEHYDLTGGNGIKGQGGFPNPWAHKYAFQTIRGGIDLHSK